MNPHPRLLHRGFTLLELLVAVTITLAISAVMLAAVRATLRQWARVQARQSESIAAQQVLDLLERDFQSALWRADSVRRLAVDLVDTSAGLANHGWLFSSGPMKPSGTASQKPLPAAGEENHPLGQLRFGLSGAWLRFVTINVESGGGLPTIVSYQVVRRPVIGNPTSANPAPVHYALYRSVVSDSETFAKGYDVLATAYESASNTPSSALSTAYRQSRNVTNPSHANLLASNVVDFGCWLYARSPGGELTRIFPASPGDAMHHATGDGATDDTRLPEVADVFVRILGESGAAVLEALEAGRLARPSQFSTDAEWWWNAVDENSQVYFRRIEIQGRTP